MKGFTLIELLFTVALIGIIALFGIGSSAWFIHKNEQQTLMDEIKNIVHYAKIQAVQTGKPTYLSPLDPEFDWSKGVVLSQLNKKTNTMEPCYQWQWYHPHWHVSWSGTNRAHKITFSNNAATAISNGQFTLVNPGTHQEITLILNRLGRVRIV